jgi:hypothetical protein
LNIFNVLLKESLDFGQYCEPYILDANEVDKVLTKDRKTKYAVKYKKEYIICVIDQAQKE